MKNIFPLLSIIIGALMIGGVVVSGLMAQTTENRSWAFAPKACKRIACAIPPKGCEYVKTDQYTCGCGMLICALPSREPTSRGKVLKPTR
jgi:hypothetical protein